MAAQTAPVVTDDQASEALRALLGQTEEEPGTVNESQEQPPEPEQPPVGDPPADDDAAEAIAEPDSDDVESLKARLSDLETKFGETEKTYRAKLEAVTTRSAQNEQVLRDRYLRKASATDNALKVLRSARTDAGVSEQDVDRVLRELESTMNPASTSYAPPETPGRAVATEDQALVMNNFLNERGMTVDEAEAFGKWITAEATTAMHPAELAVAASSLDGFLRLAHNRYVTAAADKEKQTKRSDVVGAVRSVQNTQRQALRAGSASPAAPRKQPTGARQELDVAKLTKDDVSELLRMSVQQYK